MLKAAATAPGSQAMEIPNLSHSFMPVVGPPNGREVLQPGTISPLLLDPLAKWLLNVAPR